MSRQAGWISAVLLDGGRIAGTWAHVIGPSATRITVSPWRRLSRAEGRAVDAEAARVAAYLAPGVPVELVIADPV